MELSGLTTCVSGRRPPSKASILLRCTDSVVDTHLSSKLPGGCIGALEVPESKEMTEQNDSAGTAPIIRGSSLGRSNVLRSLRHTNWQKDWAGSAPIARGSRLGRSKVLSSLRHTNSQKDWAGTAPITSGSRLGRSEVLRNLRHTTPRAGEEPRTCTTPSMAGGERHRRKRKHWKYIQRQS